MKPVLLLSIALVVALLANCSRTPEKLATLVLQNGQVRTPDGWAEAVAIRDGRIVAVGGNEAISELIGDGTEAVDLEEATVLPGFHDMHVHPLFGGMTYSGADYTNCTIEQGSSLESLQDALRECVDRISGDEWMTGGQWDASTLGQPNRSMLDEVAPETPVLLRDTSGHSALANSKALQIAGVDASTPDPEGGIIERDVDGEPTGVLREAAIGLVRTHVPPPPHEVIREALRWSLDRMLSYGITSFTEASNGFVAGGRREAELYVELADEGLLRQRVQICMNWLAGDSTPETAAGESLIVNRANYNRERLVFDCVKIFLDGVPTDSHTAAMLEPYAGTIEGRDDEAARYGLLLLEQDVTDEAVTRFDKEGLTVKFHAAGDAAVRSGLDAIAAAREANGINDLYHNVGHCTFVAPSDLPRADRLHAAFEMSPYLWSPTPINDDITAAIGEDRIRRVWPVRDAIDAGALVVPGSDWAVVPSVNPWLAIEALVTRERPGGSEDSFGKGQAITVEEAIDLFTVESARQLGKDDALGRIAPGMLADLVVIDRNPYEIPAHELHQVVVLKTYIEGDKVFDLSERESDR